MRILAYYVGADSFTLALQGVREYPYPMITYGFVGFFTDVNTHQILKMPKIRGPGQAYRPGLTLQSFRPPLYP
jgi:hypothetical protein